MNQTERVRTGTLDEAKVGMILSIPDIDVVEAVVSEVLPSGDGWQVRLVDRLTGAQVQGIPDLPLDRQVVFHEIIEYS